MGHRTAAYFRIKNCFCSGSPNYLKSYNSNRTMRRFSSCTTSTMNNMQKCFDVALYVVIVVSDTQRWYNHEGVDEEVEVPFIE